MSDFVSAEAGLVQKFVERFPQLGIFASLSGAGASVLAAVKILSVLLGFAGGLFSLLAGYYTFRVYRRKWKQAQLEDSVKITVR